MKAVQHFQKMQSYSLIASAFLCISFIAMLFNFNTFTVCMVFAATGALVGFNMFITEHLPNSKNDDYTATHELLTLIHYKKKPFKLNEVKPRQMPHISLAFIPLVSIIVAIVGTFICAVSNLGSQSSNVAVTLTLGEFLAPFVFLVVNMIIALLITNQGCKDYNSRIKDELDAFETENEQVVAEFNQQLDNLE